MSQSDDDSFAHVLNGITGSPSRPGGRRGLFGRRRKADDADPGGPAGRGDDAVSDADREAARALDDAAGGAHRSPPGGVPLGPPSGPPPGGAQRLGWRPHTGRPVFPHGDPALPPTAPVDVAVGRHQWPDYPDGPRTGDEPPESSFVRPYAWTRGRTRPAYDLAIETLVSTTDQGRDPAQVTQYEHRMIADLCGEPKSVAEVAALLRLPLGVARVLLGDMAAHGSIVVHETASSTGDAPDLALMERVLSGLRRL
ncbi:DUF742 domain-containing protein [Actinomycetospora atypica]|uniref:DUF742 domain-containing protein n=1 Tax=Actinomycetospora atypica TaxID=1290095 RepID=A0ABV9YTN3_9PSEU